MSPSSAPAPHPAPGPLAPAIHRFRAFNRFYTGLLGLLGRRILGGPLSLGEARLLFEIGRRPGLRAADLGAELDLDKGYLSRTLAALDRSGLIERAPLPEDRRALALRLTPRGHELLAELEARSDHQAGALLARLAEPARREAAAAMDALEGLLAPAAPQWSGANRARPAPRAETVIRPARPGDLGYVVESHGRIYHREHGFDARFEGYVVDGLAEFLRADPARRTLLVAELDGRTVGSVACMPRPGGLGQVRWFLVEPECRGRGAGRALMNAVLDHARRAGLAGAYLWTIDSLAPARGLYRSLGFQCTETKPGEMGGVPVSEERWDLAL